MQEGRAEQLGSCPGDVYIVWWRESVSAVRAGLAVRCLHLSNHNSSIICTSGTESTTDQSAPLKGHGALSPHLFLCHCCANIIYQDVWLLSSSASKLARISSQWWAKLFFPLYFVPSALLLFKMLLLFALPFFEIIPAAFRVWLSLLLHGSDEESIYHSPS